MNNNHTEMLPSREWARHMHEDILPFLLQGRELGERMLEVGAGPGAATEFLRHKVATLVAVDIDAATANALNQRFDGGNVEVWNEDATSLVRALDASFDSVACFTMLHHVPTFEAQNMLLKELLRVLRPGGVLVGSDSLPGNGMHRFHEGDAYNPVDPAALYCRLAVLGYHRITVSTDGTLMFSAYKPSADDPHPYVPKRNL